MEDSFTFYRKHTFSLSVAELSVMSTSFVEAYGMSAEYRWLWFNRLNVYKPERRKGVGTELMNEVIANAREKGFNILCAPSPVEEYTGMKVEELVRFYKKFGFQGNNECLVWINSGGHT